MSGQTPIELQAALLLSEYVALADDCLRAVEAKDPIHIASPSRYNHCLIAIGLLQKAFCTSRAIATLVDKKLVGDAAILTRSLLELTVTLLYVGQEPEARAELYMNFRHVQRWHLHRKARRLLPDDGELLRDTSTEVERNYEKHRPAYVTSRGRTRLVWHAASGDRMAAEVGLADLWDATYGVDSGLVHSGPDGLDDYVEQTPTGSIRLTTGLVEHDTSRLLLQACHCMHHVVGEAGKVLELPDSLASRVIGLFGELMEANDRS